MGNGQGIKVVVDGGEAAVNTGLGVVLSHGWGGNCRRMIL